jgi:hypothetical protein
MSASLEPGVEHIEILPIVVVAQDFPARPSALPDVRDFVRRQLTTTSVADEDIRTLCDRVAEVLLDAAGVSGTIQVSLRIFPTAAEVDVLFAPNQAPAADRTGAAQAAALRVDAARTGAEPPPGRGTRVVASRLEPDLTAQLPASDTPSFATWLSARLRAEGMTMEAAARRLEVSTKTISRWVSGATEPRLRDLYRIRDVFGEPPFH